MNIITPTSSITVIAILILHLLLSTTPASGTIPLHPFPPHLQMNPKTAVISGNTAPPMIALHFATLHVWHGHPSSSFICGGTILSSRHILTAAHCLFHPQTSRIAQGLSVYAGRQTLFPPGVSPIPAAHFHVHKSYKAVGKTPVYLHDVAVVTMSQKLPAFVKPVRLATRTSNEPTINGSVLAVGFGRTDDQSPKLSPVLRRVALKITPVSICKPSEKEMNRKWIFAKSVVCATSKGFPDKGGGDTCDGDSGGPIYMLKGDKGLKFVLQVGITSWASDGCGRKGGVAWYTRISRYATDVLDVVKGTERGSSIWTKHPE